MKKVLFDTQDRWAFGSIHHALNKVLYSHGIYCNLLDWTKQTTNREFELLNNTYDVFVTMPDAVLSLHSRGIPLSKIITIAHGQWDILLAKSQATFDFYPHLKGFGVISDVLKSKCIEWGISVIPDVVELGIHFDLFYSKVTDGLKVVGYGGDKETLNFGGQEIKRPSLVPRVVSQVNGVELKSHEFFNFFCMPSYYKEIDCLMMSSTEEAGGLPVMEAAAAGRLVMGTPVGYFEHNAPKGGGILLPIDEDNFIKSAKEKIEFYRDNSEAYLKKCVEIQEFARYNYDWSLKINKWIELLNK